MYVSGGARSWSLSKCFHHSAGKARTLHCPHARPPQNQFPSQGLDSGELARVNIIYRGDGGPWRVTFRSPIDHWSGINCYFNWKYVCKANLTVLRFIDKWLTVGAYLYFGWQLTRLSHIGQSFPTDNVIHLPVVIINKEIRLFIENHYSCRW